MFQSELPPESDQSTKPIDTVFGIAALDIRSYRTKQILITAKVLKENEVFEDLSDDQMKRMLKRAAEQCVNNDQLAQEIVAQFYNTD